MRKIFLIMGGPRRFLVRWYARTHQNQVPLRFIRWPTRERLPVFSSKIASVFKPAASHEPEAKPVKAAALPSTVAAEDVKVGTVVRAKGQIFKVIEMDDGSMTVVTMGKLSKKDSGAGFFG